MALLSVGITWGAEQSLRTRRPRCCMHAPGRAGLGAGRCMDGGRRDFVSPWPSAQRSYTTGSSDFFFGPKTMRPWRFFGYGGRRTEREGETVSTKEKKDQDAPPMAAGGQRAPSGAPYLADGADHLHDLLVLGLGRHESALRLWRRRQRCLHLLAGEPLHVVLVGIDAAVWKLPALWVAKARGAGRRKEMSLLADQRGAASGKRARRGGTWIRLIMAMSSSLSTMSLPVTGS